MQGLQPSKQGASRRSLAWLGHDAVDSLSVHVLVGCERFIQVRPPGLQEVLCNNPAARGAQDANIHMLGKMLACFSGVQSGERAASPAGGCWQ